MFRCPSLLLGPVAALLALPLLTGCGLTDSGKPQVVASFYPLQFVAERIVGSHAEVTNLTAPGVEPHDLELTVRQTARVSGAEVGLYEKGLQPSVDRAMKNEPPKHTLDVTDAVRLAGAPAGVEAAGSGQDPHFWQDPTLLAKVATRFAAVMAKDDPDHAADYRANDAALQRDLLGLDADYRTGLTSCRTDTLVVSHDAFEYLGRRYHLDVHPIAGLSPDAEPSPRHIAELSDLIDEDEITTVFNERLASAKLARSLAGDLGIRTAVLDPLEGLTSADPHASYLTLMRENLAAIRKANSCR